MSQNRTEQMEMLARFFNMQTGKAFRFGKSENQTAIYAAMDRANGDIRALKEHVRKWVSEHTEEQYFLIDCFDAYEGEAKVVEAEATPVVVVTPEVETAPAASSVEGIKVETAMTILSDAVVKILQETKQDDIENRIMKGIEKKIEDFIQKEYGTIERKCITYVDGKKVEIEGVQHEKFEQVLQFVANNEPVFLTGPAGSGKNVLCQQVAKALGLNFYFSNAVTQEYKITGFTDAMGVFHESQFYKAFKNGGLFMLDEMDASIPEVLVILNAAIANRYFDFPAPIGYVEAHPDFRVIAAGNTFGLGANYEYVGRNQLDMASLDRFAMVRIDYSETIEKAVALGNDELVKFARAFRAAASEAGIRIIISYRAIGRIAKLEELMGISQVLETCLIKSLEKDDINAILSNLHNSSKYERAVRELVR